MKKLDVATLHWVADYMKEHAADVLLYSGGRATDVWVFLLKTHAQHIESTSASQGSK